MCERTPVECLAAAAAAVQLAMVMLPRQIVNIEHSVSRFLCRPAFVALCRGTIDTGSILCECLSVCVDAPVPCLSITGCFRCSVRETRELNELTSSSLVFAFAQYLLVYLLALAILSVTKQHMLTNQRPAQSLFTRNAALTALIGGRLREKERTGEEDEEES